MTWIEIPFTGGAREDVEQRLLPQGTLASVRNLTLAKDNRWVKRNRYSTQTLLGPSDSGQYAGGPIEANPIISLAQRGTEQLVYTGEPAVLYSRAANQSGEAGPFQVSTLEGNAVARLAPTLSAPISSRVADSTGIVVSCDSATSGLYTVVAVVDVPDTVGVADTRYLRAYIYSEVDGALIATQLIDSGDLLANVQLVALDDHIVLGWVEGDDPVTPTAVDFKIAWLDVSSSGITTFTSATTVDGLEMTGNDYGAPSLQRRKSGVGWDALLLSWQAGATTIRVETRLDTNLSAVATTEDIATAATGALDSTVYADADDSLGWAAWLEKNSTDGFACSFTDETLSTANAEFSLTVTTNNAGPPTIARRNATTVWIAWTKEVTGIGDDEDGFVVQYMPVTTTGAGSLESVFGIRLMSHLFTPDETTWPAANSFTSAFACVAPDHSTSRLTHGAYYIVQLPETGLSDTNGTWIHARFAEEQAVIQTPVRELGHVSRSLNREWIYCQQVEVTDRGESVNAWRFFADGYYRGQPAAFGEGLYYSGGICSRWSGRDLLEAGFLEPPEIISLTANGGGSLTESSTYSYVAVYERENADGTYTLSTPSEAATIDLGAGEDGVTVVVRACKLQQTKRPCKIRLYRTLANGSSYLLEETALAPSWDDNLHASISDTQSDNDLEDNSPLYTDVGLVLGNDPAPACRGLFRAGQRLWAFGLEQPTRVRCSKRAFSGEAAAFPITESYSIVLHDPVIGGGSLDSIPVFFTERGITIAVGDGPDDAGVGLFEPKEIPVDAGLARYGQRSIVECVHGLLYQSADGIWLMPRGFGPPEYVGAPVRDTLEAYPIITSAVVVPSAQEVRFTCVDDRNNPSAGVMLAWDLRTRAWSINDVDADSSPIMAAAVWGSTHVLAGLQDGANLEVLTETTAHSGTYIPSEITTGDLRPGAAIRHARCREVQFLLEFRATCTVEAELVLTDEYIDSASYPRTYNTSWDLDAADYAVGQTVVLRWHLPVQKATRFRLRVSDTNGTASAGVVYLGMAVDLRAKSGGGRLRGANRA